MLGWCATVLALVSSVDVDAGSHLTSDIDWTSIRQFGFGWSPSWRRNGDFCRFSAKKGIVLTCANCVVPQGLVLWVVAAS